MTTVIIDDNNVQAKQYACTLPFETVVEEQKSFKDACAECNAVSVDDFFDELDVRIKKRFNA